MASSASAEDNICQSASGRSHRQQRYPEDFESQHSQWRHTARMKGADSAGAARPPGSDRCQDRRPIRIRPVWHWRERMTNTAHSRDTRRAKPLHRGARFSQSAPPAAISPSAVLAFMVVHPGLKLVRTMTPVSHPISQRIRSPSPGIRTMSRIADSDVYQRRIGRRRESFRRKRASAAAVAHPRRRRDTGWPHGSALHLCTAPSALLGTSGCPTHQTCAGIRDGSAK